MYTLPPAFPLALFPPLIVTLPPTPAVEWPAFKFKAPPVAEFELPAQISTVPPVPVPEAAWPFKVIPAPLVELGAAVGRSTCNRALGAVVPIPT